MKQTYVFIGTYSEALVGGVRLTEFGQRIELTEDLGATTVEPGGLICIPAADFDALGFTPSELAKWKKTATHGRAPAEFLAKKRAALMKLHERREVTAIAAQPPESPVQIEGTTIAEGEK